MIKRKKKKEIKIAKITEDSITKQEYFDTKPTKKHIKETSQKMLSTCYVQKKKTKTITENNKSNFTISKITLILM